MNDVGEPCAGEPHARFDAAAGGNPGPVGTAARPPDASRRPYAAVTRVEEAGVSLPPAEATAQAASTWGADQLSGRAAAVECREQIAAFLYLKGL